MTHGKMSAALLAAAALFASPAAAGEARCLWEHFPEAKRTAVLDHDLAEIGTAMDESFTFKESAAAFSACGATDRTRAAANAALNAYALEMKAEKALLAAGDLAPDKLDAAWNALDPATRAALVKRAAAGSGPDPTVDAVERFADRLGLTGEVSGEVAIPLAAYLLARAALVVYEQRF